MKLNSHPILLLILVALPFLGFSQIDTTTVAPPTEQHQQQQQPQEQPQHTTPTKPKSNIMDRLYIGGNLGLYFGDITYVAISPIVGYRFTENLTAGVGFTYQYYKDNYYNYTNNIYGGLIFGRYNVFKGLFLEGDFEANNLDAYYTNQGVFEAVPTRKWIPSLLLGAGYSGGGSAGGFYFSILYDVLQNYNSPYYGVPIIRAGVGFGI
jgi:hypothetical protein